MERRTERKARAHFEVFGYEPERMKPAHFATGFFLSLTGQAFENRRLNTVAVTRAKKGLLGDYVPEAVAQRLRDDGLISDYLEQGQVELLRTQVNGVVNNDDAMYPAFAPYRPAGNDYTFFTPQLLTQEKRKDGFSGHFVAQVLAHTEVGRRVLEWSRLFTTHTPDTLELLIEPLLADEQAIAHDICDQYTTRFGDLENARLDEIAAMMESETNALDRLRCNAVAYSRYRQTRFLIIGLLAWLLSYLIKRSSPGSGREPVVFFDFLEQKQGRTRIQSKACYARLRGLVGQAYERHFGAGTLSFDPLSDGTFVKGNNGSNQPDFAFLEQHFSDLALRVGYAQPRANRVNDKHFELQPDTLRVLALSLLDGSLHDALPLDDFCRRLREEWSILVGANPSDLQLLRDHGYFGLDEEDLRANSRALAERLKGLNLAVEPSDGLVLCATRVEAIV